MINERNAKMYCKNDISKLFKGKTWKVINGKRVWLSKEGK